MNPVEIFAKTNENLTFDLLWPYSGSKRAQKYGPGAHILHMSNSSSSEVKKASCESSGNLLQNRQKTDFGPNFGTIQGQNGPENVVP